MKIKMPTDLDPTAGIPRPDQVAAPMPQPMPTLADLGVKSRLPVAGDSPAGSRPPATKATTRGR